MSNTETNFKYSVTMAGPRHMVNDHFNFENRCGEVCDNSEDQHFEDKFAINMLTANGINPCILTYLLR